MLGFLSMMSDYEDRAISNTTASDPEGRTIEVDTCRVNDSDPYTSETAVRVDGGKWVVVQCYMDDDEAALGHLNWVKIVEHGDLPDPLVDMGQNFFSKLCRALSPALEDGRIIDA